MQEIDRLLEAVRDREPWVTRVMQECYHEDVTKRFIRTLECFAERFPKYKKVTLLRAPGRVNLIGEHTDYNGLPVMPMAVDHNMLVAVAPRKDMQIKAVNVEYPDRNFWIERQIPPSETGDWGNYIKAGVQGVIDELGGTERLRGFNACFVGNVPMGAGMSSSSTLVVASAMAALEAGGIAMDPQALAERCAQAEWYVGTQGGGMDHASSLLSQKGKALKIDFFPLRVRPVSVPEGYTIVVANSMVVADKTKNARMKYNRRPAICRAATAMLIKSLGLERENLRRLGDIYYLLGREQTIAAVDRVFTQPVYTKDDIAAFLGTNCEQVDQDFFTTKSGELIPEPEAGFQVGARARHVVTEAARVEDAAAAVESGDGEAFGRLMNLSHASCRDNYEISHPALDELILIARRAGSSGSRLTGAGFGGCTVHLVQDSRVEDFLARVKRHYFDTAIEKYPQAAERYRNNPLSALLALRPSSGARVLY